MVADIMADICKGMNKPNPQAQLGEIAAGMEVRQEVMHHAHEGDLIKVVCKALEMLSHRDGVKASVRGAGGP
jgi:hypothetical protein